jgi:hypothetical protein
VPKRVSRSAVDVKNFVSTTANEEDLKALGLAKEDRIAVAALVAAGETISDVSRLWGVSGMTVRRAVADMPRAERIAIARVTAAEQVALYRLAARKAIVELLSRDLAAEALDRQGKPIPGSRAVSIAQLLAVAQMATKEFVALLGPAGMEEAGPREKARHPMSEWLNGQGLSGRVTASVTFEEPSEGSAAALPASTTRDKASST